MESIRQPLGTDSERLHTIVIIVTVERRRDETNPPATSNIRYSAIINHFIFAAICWWSEQMAPIPSSSRPKVVFHLWRMEFQFVFIVMNINVTRAFTFSFHSEFPHLVHIIFGKKKLKFPQSSLLATQKSLLRLRDSLENKLQEFTSCTRKSENSGFSPFLVMGFFNSFLLYFEDHLSGGTGNLTFLILMIINVKRG